MRPSHVLLWAILCAGCSAPPTQTVGLEGNASFSFLGRAPSAPTTKPMMVGTQETIAITGVMSTLPAVSAVSSAPTVVSIAQVGCCNGVCDPSSTDACPATTAVDVLVNALAAGSATLMVLRGDGTTFDEVNLSVAEPTSLDVLCAPFGETNSDPPTFSTTGSPEPIPASMTMGSACALTWTASDTTGDDLMASTGVTFTSSDAAVVAFEPIDLFSVQPATLGMLEATQALGNVDLLVATGSGQSTIVATARAATQSASVQVAP